MITKEAFVFIPGEVENLANVTTVSTISPSLPHERY
jgi:hypothetical protein